MCGGTAHESGEVVAAGSDARDCAALVLPGTRPLAPLMITSAILIRNGTALPGSIGLETEPCSGDWRSVTNLDRRGLDQQLSKAGWTFFYMAGEIGRSAFGFNAN